MLKVRGRLFDKNQTALIDLIRSRQGELVHLRRSCYAIGPPMVDLGYETTSLYSTIDR
jgi:hypothetical protein